MLPAESPQEPSGPAFAALRRGEQCCSGGGACPELVERISRLPQSPAPAERGRASAASRAVALREGGPVTPERSVGGFTLVELLVVIGIVALLMALIAPAFTNIKSGTDVTSAAYTIKGVLDTARTYAKANNNYAWVGFFEEDGSISSTNPATAGPGRVVMSIVASRDGTMLYTIPLGAPFALD